MRALVTGATGWIGRRLLERLQDPVILSRNPEKAAGGKAFRWGPAFERPPAEAFEGIDTVFHLAGEPVAGGRWTAERKQRIRDSRIQGTRYLVDAIRDLPAKPAVLVSASAVGYYGHRGEETLDESAGPGHDFLADVCQQWEAEAARAGEAGVRVVTPRIGIVLGRGGGALAQMLTPFKLGVGGRLGDGRQWMPWVHLDDVVGLLLHAAQNSSVSGPMNATAPAPVRNADFTKTLASVLHRPAIFPVPVFGLKLMFGEMSDILLASQRVTPRVAQQTGYQFRYTDLREALAASM
jgi:hypothetical protein